MSAPAIVVDGVSKRYRLYSERNESLKASLLRRGRARYEEFWAVDDVSLEVPTGVTFGLIGENGSGKSTLLKCLARILTPERGSITVRGKVSALLELGAGFHPELSGRENVYLNAAILGMGRRQIDAAFDDIVGFAGLERFIDMPVKTYSSGMYVRLGFSVAINVEPDVLLVDEVLAVGDEEFQRRCQRKISDLQEGGRTIVVVSHAMGTVRNICDQVAWLEHGRLRAVGEPGNIVDDYLGEVRSSDAASTGMHPEDGARWGDGRALVEEVELLDSTGRPTTTVRTGDAVAFRVRYRAAGPVERPIFGLGVHRSDGVHVTGPNTKSAGLVPDRIDGEGTVLLHVDRLLLLPGRYDLSAAIYDHGLAEAHDHRHRFFHFDVEPGEPREEIGIVSLGGKWDLDGI